jgi:hypothetical protein
MNGVVIAIVTERKSGTFIIAEKNEILETDNY